MLNKKVIIPLALVASAIFAVGYGISTNYESVISLFTHESTFQDTTDHSSTPGGDVSQMFNERGFYKSNSVSFDENEIINDFNGNLMYEVPLYNFNGGADINCDVKLVYNGSVNHQVIIMDSTDYINSGLDFPKHNINFPEWIISVNGIAAQVMNFETRFLTEPNEPNTISDNAVRCLIPGYHFDDRLVVVDVTGKDRIYILMGDGSCLTLINKTYNPGDLDSLKYSGSYFSDGKGSHIKANVYFYETSTDNVYRNRIVELMMGDGLIYVFKEYKRNYELATTTSGITSRRPQVLLLEEIRDMFGHKLLLSYYSNPYSVWGRPLLTAIGGGDGVTLQYLTNGMLINNYSIGNYKLQFDDQVTYGRGGNKRPGISKITNPSNQEALITYDNNYSRTLLNLPYPTFQNGQDISLTSLTMKRISEFKSFLGGKNLYTYVSSGQLTLDYTTQMILYSTLRSSSSNDYKGYGRDAFFSNMINTKISKERNNSDKAKVTYGYIWTPSNGTWNVENAIDTGDFYKTTKIIESLNDTTFNESREISSYKEYRLYKVRTYGIYNPENIDVTAVTRLIKDVTLDDEQEPYSEDNFIYEQGGRNGNIYLGSFNILKKENTIEGKSRLWTFGYTYKNDEYDSVVTQKIEVDPNGYKTQIFYDNFDIVLKFIDYGMPGQAVNNPPAYLTFWGNKRFFKVGIDTLIRKFSKNGDRYQFPPISNFTDSLLQKISNGYSLDSSNSAGYYGQKIYEKVYAYGSNNNYIQTDFQYYKRDTTGRHLYYGSQFPNIEGNIKLTAKTGGQEEKYFYYPIQKDDDVFYDEGDVPHGYPSSPQIWFKVKYNDGTEMTRKETLMDYRYPIRIDNYQRLPNNSRDTLKKIYMSYNQLGKPVMMINENGYLTYLGYDNTYNRIKEITLPGDFSKSSGVDTSYVLTRQVDSVFNYDTDGWGSIDFNPSTPEVKYMNSDSANCGWISFTMKYDVQGVIKLLPFMKFSKARINQFIRLDSANLYSVPQWFTLRIGQTTYSQGYDFKFKAVTGHGATESIGNCLRKETAEVHTFQIAAPFDDSIYEDYLYDANHNCEYNPHTLPVGALLNNLIANNKNLYGLYINYNITNQAWLEDDTPPNFSFRMFFSDCINFDYTQWLTDYKPKLTIYGLFEFRDTIKYHLYKGGTYIYEYDDSNFVVTVKSRLTNSGNNFKNIKYRLDGFGNVQQKDIYKTISSYDSYLYKFNFLNQPSRNTDGTGDATYFSYDLLGRQVKTKNADNSSSTTTYSYQSSLQTSFYNISNDLIEKQTSLDENGRQFNKYFDNVGNLLREEKFVAGDGNGNIEEIDNPYNPDTTYEGQDIPPQQISLNTDYKYDNLYRLQKVKSPGGKVIEYWYDSYGRQMQRLNVDASYSKYTYDNLGNLIYTQDAKQRAISNNIWSVRSYDGLNRLLTIGEVTKSSLPRDDNSGSGESDTTAPIDEEYDSSPLSSDSLYVVNVYDTISNTSYGNIFTQIPQGYSSKNFTRGRLTATAFRTVLGEQWSFKFYRYDERGNVIKFWQKLAGMDSMKVIEYKYNSQNQATNIYYQYLRGDWRYYAYYYDDASRLINAGLLNFNGTIGGIEDGPPVPGDEEIDNPNGYWSFKSFALYSYNPDQQISQLKLNNDNALTYNYSYNNRNWLVQFMRSGVGPFGYILNYNFNGNIKWQYMLGSYDNLFGSTGDLYYSFIYDNSNRLVKADRDQGQTTSLKHDIIMSYDKDGNLNSLKRYSSDNFAADSFKYNYYSISGLQSNRLKNITSSKEQYSYDANGNVIIDSTQQNYQIKYDWRNLITELRRWRPAPGGGPGPGQPEIWVYKTHFWYDEAGNRICKKFYQWYVSEIDPGIEDISDIVEGDSPTGFWQILKTTYYIRDVSGKEIAIYSGNSIEQWNLTAIDNVGELKANGNKLFYLKDHLGTVRVVIDTTETIAAAYDYDPWGYPLYNRTYESTSEAAPRYKFTGKERDKESGIDGLSGYDYFGARYYDSRIANWTSIDPLFEKHFDYSPYNYVLRNPIYFYDPDGAQESAVLKFTFEITKQSVKTAAPLLGIPLGPIGLISNFIFSPQEFGYSELKDIKKFYPGPEGFLEYLNELPEINIIALRSESGIYIPDEDKIPLDQINPPKARGYAPTDKETELPIEIHHVNQNPEGPYIEMKRGDHRGKGNKNINHDPKKKSTINRKEWNKEQKKYWKGEWDRGRFNK